MLDFLDNSTTSKNQLKNRMAYVPHFFGTIFIMKNIESITKNRRRDNILPRRIFFYVNYNCMYKLLKEKS